MNKIAIIGAGRVGEDTAQFLAKSNICREIVLVDVRPGIAEGAALDTQESAPLFGFDTRLYGTTDIAAICGSEMVIVTAGIPRKPGMSRSDIIDTNAAIIDDIVDAVVAHAPDSILLVVTNPVDALTWRAFTRSGFPRERVFGQAGVLDSSRMASFIAMESGLSVCDINAMVLGGHGDGMVPLMRYSTINGIPVSEFLDEAALARIIERTRNGGAEILALKQTSSAYSAPAASIVAMIEAVALNRRRVLPTIAILDGEYGEKGLAMGVPCVLGRNGLERIVEIGLDEDERRAFATSVAGVRSDIVRLK